MLTDSQIETLKTSLEAERARIVANAEGARDFSRDRDRDRIGRDSLDESVEEEMYGTKLRLHDRETYLLGKINQALERLADGILNECAECEEPIGYARLKARPVTTLCIACKEAEEDEGG